MGMVEDFIKVTVKLEISDTLAENLRIPIAELQRRVMVETVRERTLLLRKVILIVSELIKVEG